MKTLFRHFLALSYCLLLGLSSCSEEFQQLTPPEDPVVSCRALPIEKNIIGTWKFESNYTKDNRIKKGTIIFDQRGSITDPDSLFENELDLGVVTSKTYTPSVPSPFSNYQGTVFKVYQLTEQGKKQITYFVVVTNECTKIHLSLFQSGGNKVGFVLTK